MLTDKYRTETLHLAKTQNLNVEQFKQLQQLSAINIDPLTQVSWLKRALLMLGGMCLGLGIIFFVAANWDNLTNFHRFAMVEGLLATALLIGCFTERAKAGVLLLAVLALGGLLALYAQVYSTQSGPWRLFAIWALMALPIVLAAKHQVTWLFWWLVVMITMSLWFQNYYSGADIMILLASWAIVVLLSMALYPRGLLKGFLGRYSHLAFRGAMSSSLIFILITAIIHLFGYRSGWFLPSLLAMSIITGIPYLLYRVGFYDRVLIAIATLSFDILLIIIWIKIFTYSSNIDAGGLLFVVLIAGLFSAFIFSMSIKFLKKVRAIELGKSLTTHKGDHDEH